MRSRRYVIKKPTGALAQVGEERKTGFEPATSTLARSRSTNWATFAKFLWIFKIKLFIGFISMILQILLFTRLRKCFGGQAGVFACRNRLCQAYCASAGRLVFLQNTAFRSKTLQFTSTPDSTPVFLCASKLFKRRSKLLTGYKIRPHFQGRQK